VEEYDHYLNDTRDASLIVCNLQRN